MDALSAEHNEQNAEKSGDVCGDVAECHHRHVRGEPKVGVKHGLHHFHRVIAITEPMRDECGNEPKRGADQVPEPQRPDKLQKHVPFGRIDSRIGRLPL